MDKYGTFTDTHLIAYRRDGCFVPCILSGWTNVFLRSIGADWLHYDESL